jgi:hypothetical protein
VWVGGQRKFGSGRSEVGRGCSVRGRGLRQVGSEDVFFGDEDATAGPWKMGSATKIGVRRALGKGALRLKGRTESVA